VLLMESRGDSAWSAPQVVMANRTASGHEMVSPSFVRRPRGWRAWFVDGACGAPSTLVLTARSADGRSGFGERNPVAIAQPGYVVWHLQVRAFRGALWMLFAAYAAPGHTCYESDLFLARSADGVRWTTYAQPVLDHRAWPEFAAGLYRSSMVYDSAKDLLTLQVSGFHRSRDSLAASLRMIRFPFEDLLGRIGTAAPSPPPAGP
jgi:hypothetical protein